MQNRFKHISCLLSVLLCTLMHGQALTSLPTAKEITKGSLPDGMAYYLVTNAAEKGRADFALVQKGEPDPSKDARNLTALPHFETRKPYHFLSDNGVGYSDFGYVSHQEDASVFSFQGVPTSDQAAADSVLLMIFDIAASSSEPQAVIVSGDISADKIKERMGLLSMMVPKLSADVGKSQYKWYPNDSLSLRISTNPTADVATINVMFSAERTSKVLMNTIQPVVSRTYAYELGHIINNRVSRAFRKENIPLAATSYRYLDSSQSPLDERYSFSVYTSSRSLGAATKCLSTVLAELDKGGAGLSEFQDARNQLVSEAEREADGKRLTNSEYVSKCVSSYLFGSTLASDATLNGYIAGGRLSAERELQLFNGFATALLDPARNLTIRYDVPDTGIDQEALTKTFNSAWAKAVPGEDEYKEDFSDTLSLYNPIVKVKLRSETAEPISGGKLWTFSNGIKVVYKKTSVKGEFRYALMMRGGFASVPGLKEGEGAFVGDMLKLCDVAGLDGRDFSAMLGANGITMEHRASLSDLRITGAAPTKRLHLLMRSLLSISDSRKVNRESFEYYKRNEGLRLDMESLTPRDVNSLMDSIMRPEYYYTDRKTFSRLQDDLPERSEVYFAQEFAKVNDGLLVFMGDVDEETLKKELCRTLGGFRTQKKFSPRPQVNERYSSGSVTYTVDSAPGLVGGGELGVNVAMSSGVTFSLSNYMNFRVASEMLRRSLVSALAEKGSYVEVSDKVEVFPSERMSLYINCHPCRQDGLPEGVAAAEPLSMLGAVRSVTGHIPDIKVTDKDVNAYKDLLLNEFENSLKEPGPLMEKVLTRYSEGKDMVTGYKDAVKSVTVDSVKAMLKQIDGGAEVEYVII